MSEIFELRGSQSRMHALGVREERAVVLPFPTDEVNQDSESSSNSTFLKTSGNGHAATSIAPLIKKLCETLNAQQISYCHWKSNWKLSRWLLGDGDLDLLVDRADAQRFVSIIYGLGFKRAEPPADRLVPGILNFYGFDAEAGRFIHLHVHYQLVIGHDLTKNYHLPIENIYLEHTARYGLIPLPAPEFELIVFVLRMVLKSSVLEPILRKRFERSTTSANSVALELEYLETKSDRARINALLPRVAPGIDAAFFATCMKSLRAGSSSWTRIAVRRELQRRLRTCARRSQTGDTLLKVCRRATRIVRESMLHRRPRKRFVEGGLLIAVVGGDGAGKTTTLNGLDAWLSKKFVTRRFHLGKPPRSPITLAAILVLRIRRLLTNAPPHPERQVSRNGTPIFPGYVQLLRWVSAGRDRWRLYVKARRFATNGGIAFCDRYPLPQLRLMEGPNIARTVVLKRRNTLVRWMLKAENDYYLKIMQPDLLIVLRVDPEIAVTRKTSESEHHVRVRSRELWEQRWEGTTAYVINAGQSIEDVVAEVQSIIWARL